MNDRTAALAGIGASFATVTLSQINLVLAFCTGLMGLICVAPRAVRTVVETDWKNLFRKSRP